MWKPHFTFLQELDKVIETEYNFYGILPEREGNMEEHKHSRGSWGSNFGFLMAAVGSAVGLGNLWGFPYKMGVNGGFAFLVLYIILAIVVGVTVMLGELVLGRKTGRGVVGTYNMLTKRLHFLGYCGVLCGFLIFAFYSVLGGLVLRYCIGYAMELFGASGFLAPDTGVFFTDAISNPASMVGYCAIFMFVTFLIVAGGVNGGIERFTKIAMPALAIILVGIIIFVACQPGAAEGYRFVFQPSLAPLEENFVGVLKAAAGQMFFSLSLGLGVMMTYGSFLSKKENLQRNAVFIVASDSIVALLAGMAIMPACAAFGVEYGQGPGLLFVSMQTVFANMGSVGPLIGFLFYLLVLIAAVTSSISMLEICSTFAIDRRIDAGKPPRRKLVSGLFTLAVFIVALPVALDALGGDGVLPAPYQLLGLAADQVKTWNDCWLDFYDCISEGVLMPLGAMLMSLLIGWKLKIGVVQKECEQCGNRFAAKKYFNFCFRYLVPAAMIFILGAQLYDFFF